MEQHPFIFSNQRKYRFRRHLAFWGFWAVFQGFLYSFVALSAPGGVLARMPFSMLDSVLFLPVHMFLSYSLMYFVIPVYVVNHKYGPAVMWTGMLILLTGLFSTLISVFVVEPVHTVLGARHLNYPSDKRYQARLAIGLLAGLRGGLTIGGLAAAIKLMKHWYVEGQRNLRLQKENIESQLQVLKAQVHPHFLFNTLNNIYAYTQKTAPTAATMLMGLADILRYMLYECNQPLVPLAKELRMVEDYINLEQIRYGNKLELHITFPEESEDWLIAPLLLLPFVENCFKHGTSHMLENPWLNIQVVLQENIMTAKLMNSKPQTANRSKQSGIGIENVRRRLALLYPGKHQLTINNEEEVFIVNLKLELEPRRHSFLSQAHQHAALNVIN